MRIKEEHVLFRAMIRLLLATAMISLAASCSSSGSSSDDDDDDDNAPDVVVSVLPSQFGQIIFTEVMADPGSLLDSQGEWFEIGNPTTTRFNLRDCVFSDFDTNNFIVGVDFEIGPGALRTFAISAMPGFTPNFDYSGSGLTLDNLGDTLTMICSGVTIATRTYAAAAVSEGNSSAFSRNGNGKWCLDLGNLYNLGDRGTPGDRNVICA